MSFFEFPHTRTYDTDLGWIIKHLGELLQDTAALQAWAGEHKEQYKELLKKVDGLINNLVDVISPWDSSIAYKIFSIVEYQGINYIALQDVPVGVMITNEEYWQPANTIVEQINAISEIVSGIEEKEKDLNNTLNIISAHTPLVSSSINIIKTDNANGLYDLGRDAGAVVDWLHNNNISKLDFVIISHYHNDHIGGFDSLITSDIDLSGCIFYLPHRGINWSSSTWSADYESVEESIITALSAAGINYVKPVNGETAEYDNIRITFYNTDPANYTYYYQDDTNQFGTSDETCNYNNFSMIALISHAGGTVLMSGDLEETGQKYCAGYLKDKINVYQIPHHGLNRNGDAAWAQKTNADISFLNFLDDNRVNTDIYNNDVSAQINNGIPCYTNRTKDTKIYINSEIGAEGETIEAYPHNMIAGAKNLNPVYYDDTVKTDGKVDLDKLITPGVYEAQNATQANTYVTNGPVVGSNLGYVLFIVSHIGSIEMAQFAYDVNSDRKWVAFRTRNGTTGAFRPWQYLLAGVAYNISSDLNNYANSNIIFDVSSDHSYIRIYNKRISITLWGTTSEEIAINTNIIAIPGEAVPNVQFSNFNGYLILHDAAGEAYPCRVLSSGGAMHIRPLKTIPSGVTLYGSVTLGFNLTQPN